METLQTQPEVSILDDPYAREVLEDNYRHDTNQTRKFLLFIAAQYLLGALLFYMRAFDLQPVGIVAAFAEPAIVIALGFYGKLKPMLATIAVTVFVLLSFVASFMVFGAQSLLLGIVSKGITVSLLILSYRHAISAQRAKKELAELN